MDGTLIANMLGLKLLEDEKTQDDVMYHEGIDMIGTMQRLHDKRDEDEKCDIQVFRDVVRPMDHVRGTGMMNSLSSIPSIFSSPQDLRFTNIDGLLVNDKLSPQFPKSSITDRLKIQHELNNTTLETLNDVKIFYESAFRAIASEFGSCRPVHAENITRSMFLTSHLEHMPLYVSSSIDNQLESIPGINVPIYSIAGEYAFSPLQPKKGYLDTCSLVHYSEKDLARILLCIPRKYSWPTCDALSDSCQLLTETGDGPRDWLPGCVTPHHHRNMVVTPSFLDAVGIKYSIVTQRPGDLVYLSSRVYCQSLCVGANAEESIGVGTLAWKKQIPNYMSCKCPGSEMTSVRSVDSNLTIEEVKAATGIISCEVPECGRMMKKSERFDHFRSVHGVRNPDDPQPGCIHCKAIFGNLTWLQKHIRETHLEGIALKKRRVSSKTVPTSVEV